MKNFTLFAFVMLTIASCSRNKHLTADYDKYARGHRVVAVLPYDIILKGRKVSEMDENEIQQIREVEGKLFQQSLYSEILLRTGKGDKDIDISVQGITKTNRLLKDAGINIVDIAEHSPLELGQILGVDAIISTRLVKEMFLSREEALVVDIATDVILDKSPVKLPIYDKSKMTRSSEVDIYCTIVDAEAESAIWIYNTECDLQWDTDPDDAVERINKRISKKFPYKKK